MRAWLMILAIVNNLSAVYAAAMVVLFFAQANYGWGPTLAVPTFAFIVSDLVVTQISLALGGNREFIRHGGGMWALLKGVFLAPPRLGVLYAVGIFAGIALLLWFQLVGYTKALTHESASGYFLGSEAVPRATYLFVHVGQSVLPPAALCLAASCLLAWSVLAVRKRERLSRSGGETDLV